MPTKAPSLYTRISANLLPIAGLVLFFGAVCAKIYSVPAENTVINASLLFFFFISLTFHYSLKPRIALLTALPFFFLIGYSHTRTGLEPPHDPNHIYNLIQERAKVTLVGTLMGMVEYDGQKSRFNLAVDEIRFPLEHFGQKVEPAHGLVRLALDGDHGSTFSAGSTLMVLSALDRIYNYQTPGAFDYRLHMAGRFIYVTGWVASPRHIVVIPKQLSMYEQFRFFPEQVRQQIGRFLSEQLPPTPAALYQALLIGYRGAVSPEIIEQFKATGCMHLLAISGLHMSLLALLITSLAMWLLKRSEWMLLNVHIPSLAALLSLPALVVYACIAGMNTPVFRALIMAVLVLFAVVIRRQYSFFHLVTAAALALFAVHPLVFFTVSFQLSFSAILAISLISPSLLSWIERKTGHPSSPVWRKLLIYLSAGFLISLAATIGTLPFMLYHFNRFSLLGPFMNLVVEPLLCLWALPIGLLAIPLIAVSPGLSSLFLKIGSIGLIGADFFTSRVSEIPFATLWTITPSVLEVIFYYAALFLLLNKRYRYAPILAAFSFIFLAIHFTAGLWTPKSSGETTITYLDVGQGSSTFITLPNGKIILLDGGGSATSRFDIGEQVIARFLWKQRIWSLDDTIITHPHSDHFNGMHFILRHFSPQRLFLNEQQEGEKGYRDILAVAHEKGIEVFHPRTGEIIHADQKTELRCIGMSGLLLPDQRYSVNDQSLVMHLRHMQRSFLFPADISSQTENLLIKKGYDIASDVLLAAHHGSKTSNSQSFIAAVDPELIVVSGSRKNRGKMPDANHLKAWGKKGIRAMMTGLNGTVICRTDGTKLMVTAADGKCVRFSDSADFNEHKKKPAFARREKSQGQECTIFQ